MKLEMTELGPVKRALKIEVPEEAVKSEFKKVYAQLKREARIPGFRPGKAPIELLQKRFGSMVGQDVRFNAWSRIIINGPSKKRGSFPYWSIFRRSSA